MKLDPGTILYILGILIGSVFFRIAKFFFPAGSVAEKAFLLYLCAFMVFTAAFPFLPKRRPQSSFESGWNATMRILFPSMALVGIFIAWKLFWWLS